MAFDVTAYGVKKFGSDKARPTVTRAYSASAGWVELSGWGKVRLNRSVALDLQKSGYSKVRVRWRLSTHEIMLDRYLSE